MSLFVVKGACQGPFFLDHVGQTVSKAWLVQQLRVTLQRIGLPADQYAGHSFRIGPQRQLCWQEWRTL